MALAIDATRNLLVCHNAMKRDSVPPSIGVYSCCDDMLRGFVTVVIPLCRDANDVVSG